MAAGERGLDRALTRAEPVERAIEFALLDRAEPKQPAQARTGSIGGQLARGGEFGGGRDQAAGDQRERQWQQALVGRLAEQPVEADRPDRAEHRGGMTVRQRAADGDAVRGDGDTALQQRPKPSTSAAGHAERLARVRFLTRPFSRKLSRNRMAGGELRLGTDSIYMAPLLARCHVYYNRDQPNYMATLQPQKPHPASRNPWVLMLQM